MCKLTPLSTKTVLSTYLERGNKIYIKVKKPWALCGHHDHRAAGNDRGIYLSFNGEISRKTLYVHHLWSVMVMHFNTTPNQLKFKTDREPGRLNSAVKCNLV